jgi:hypothetical protein
MESVSHLKIVAISDLHIGKEEWGNFGIEKAKVASGISDVDVLYFGGDLSEQIEGDAGFERGLEILAASPARVKLFTLGNNDLEHISSSALTNHYEEFSKKIGAFGFHLLDSKPFLLGKLAFVGNVGWYDGSLWTKFLGKTNFVNSEDAIKEAVENYFKNEQFKGKLPGGLSSEGFYQHCRSRIEEHMALVDKNPDISSVIVGTHFVPSKDFILADNPRFAFLNWCMGAEGLVNHYGHPKVIVGFTGHTHRSELHLVRSVPVYNISGQKQPRILELELMQNGKYTRGRK